MYDALTLTCREKTSTTRYRISPQSFFQTNTTGAELLFSTAASILGEIDGPLIDIYCGTGTIGIALHTLGIGSSLVGIEIVPEAIIDAHYNASINGI
jgi:23S rRNA (uracil1939-C5)-methyltransferase